LWLCVRWQEKAFGTEHWRWPGAGRQGEKKEKNFKSRIFYGGFHEFGPLKPCVSNFDHTWTRPMPVKSLQLPDGKNSPSPHHAGIINPPIDSHDHEDALCGHFICTHAAPAWKGWIY
jgi:hypothetical protein